MNEIKCPKCGTVFQINETDYYSIVKQIRDKEFQNEIEEHEKQHRLSEEKEVKLALAKQEQELNSKINEKEVLIASLKKELENVKKETKTETEKEYLEEINKKDLEINKLKSDLNNKKTEEELNIQKAVSEQKEEINKLKNKLELEKKDKEKEIDTLKSEIKSKENEYIIKETSIKEKYEEKIKSKDEQIEYYKDFKARQSTKMIGESLEVHCNNEFNKLRPLFKNSTFEKDNDIKTGSKGDFIFRDYDDDGNELVSIMFEMKNEADETSTKHKNEDFFKELDKDRKEKNCEYAVLVSLLEIENDYYNTGIVDVSHKYKKMYVIRPQFFIPLITLIRDLSYKTLEYKKELTSIRNQNIDITNFESNINDFKDAFGRNYRIASDKFKKAIEEIDKTIDHLQKTKDALLSSENNLRLANNKAEDLTIKKLTQNSETMAKMFEDLKENIK